MWDRLPSFDPFWCVLTSNFELCYLVLYLSLKLGLRIWFILLNWERPAKEALTIKLVYK